MENETVHQPSLIFKLAMSAALGILTYGCLRIFSFWNLSQGASVWIAVAVALSFLVLGQNFWRWLDSVFWLS